MEGTYENRDGAGMDALAGIREKKPIAGPSVRLRGDEGAYWTVEKGGLFPMLVRGEQRRRVPFWRVESLD